MNPLLLRDLHLEALQRTFALPDTTVGAIELVLDIALNQQHCEEMTDLVKLKDYMVETKSHLKVPFSPAAEALRYILQLEAMNAKLAEEHSEACQELATAKEEITRLGNALHESSLNVLDMERQRTQAQDELNRRRLKDIDAAMIKEAGTETAANPPSPTPTRPSYSPMLAKIADQVDTVAAQYSNGNGSNGNGKAKPEMVLNSQHLMGRLPFNWTLLPPEMQNLPDLLRTEEIDWKSLTAEQKRALGVETAAQILLQNASPSAELTRELYDNNRPAWMPTMHALCLGTPIAANELRSQVATLAASRAASRADKPSEANLPNPSPMSSAASSVGSDEPQPGSN